DQAHGTAVLFGGYGGSGGHLLGETWLLSDPVAPSWTRHGTGCPGSAGTPTLGLGANQLPALGSAISLQLGALPAQAGLALIWFGFDIVQWNGAPLPFDLGRQGLPGCKIWVAPQPAANVVIAHGGGTGSFPFAIPADPSLTGLVVGAQAFAID